MAPLGLILLLGAALGTRVMGNTTLMESTLLALILLGVTTIVTGRLMLAV
jgi:hypothetical protein